MGRARTRPGSSTWCSSSRGSHLDADAHVALGRRFGTPEIHPYIPKRDDDHPEIVVIDTVGGGAEFWHTDVTFSATPPMASILQMVMNPPRGGDTLFTNQYLAYETLSDPIRDLLEGLTAVHTATIFGHPEQNVAHPVVRTHPDTGRKSLFVNRTFTSHLVEVQRSESDALLDTSTRGRSNRSSSAATRGARARSVSGTTAAPSTTRFPTTTSAASSSGSP